MRKLGFALGVVHDEELEEGIKEIAEKLTKEMEQANPDDEMKDENDDEGFETYGEEDSDEEEQKKSGKK